MTHSQNHSSPVLHPDHCWFHHRRSIQLDTHNSTHRDNRCHNNRYAHHNRCRYRHRIAFPHYTPTMTHSQNHSSPVQHPDRCRVYRCSSTLGVRTKILKGSEEQYRWDPFHNHSCRYRYPSNNSLYRKYHHHNNLMAPLATCRIYCPLQTTNYHFDRSTLGVSLRVPDSRTLYLPRHYVWMLSVRHNYSLQKERKDTIGHSLQSNLL